MACLKQESKGSLYVLYPCIKTYLNVCRKPTNASW